MTTAKHYSDMLRQAASIAPDPELSERTRQEQAAGRDALLHNLRTSVIDTGVMELQKRFSVKVLPRPGGLRFDDHKREWVASIYVNTAAKTYMEFEEPLLDFPSEHMIAQIALVS